MSKYAKRTSVSVVRSRADIENIIDRFDCVFDGWVIEPGRVIVNFHGYGYCVRWVLDIPALLDEQSERELWRAMLIAIKGNLVSVKSGVVQFKMVFHAFLVTEDDEILSNVKYLPALKRK
jgi:hypothetical protein